MGLIKKIFNFYIFSNIHVALASFSLTKLTLLYWQINDNTIPLFVFFSTILSYNYIRLTRIKQIDYWFASWLKKNRIYLILISLIAFFFSVYLVLQLQLKTFLILLPFSFLTGLYVLPQNISKKINLRNLPAVKIFVIALSWAGITVVFPLFQYNIFSSTVFLFFMRQFLFVVVLTLPFDIRDVPYDAKSIKTLPIWLGVKKAKILGLVLLVLFFAVQLLLIKSPINWQDYITVFFLALLLLKASTNQNKYYSAFWVEGIPILWLLLYISNDYF